MKEIFKVIWGRALAYQDQRNDHGHAEVTLRYAQQLLTIEQGDENVVIPAIILHDVGWSELPDRDKFLAFDHQATAEDKRAARFRHQERGVKIAQQILQAVDYPKQWREEILEIISQHDTRQGFFSANDGLVRDADRLWRFSQVGFAADVARGYDPAALVTKLQGRLAEPDFFYSLSARKIAEQELALRVKELA